MYNIIIPVSKSMRMVGQFLYSEASMYQTICNSYSMVVYTDPSAVLCVQYKNNHALTNLLYCAFFLLGSGSGSRARDN